MRCLVAMDPIVLADIELLQEQVAELVEFVSRQNRSLMRKLGKRIPPLYDSGVLYREDPWDPGYQHFADCVTVLRRGYGDCKSLVPWRLAGLREERPSEHFAAHVYPRRAPRGSPRDGVRVADEWIIHVQVRMPDGLIEDPSRMLHQ
jgi:hypothetical protein